MVRARGRGQNIDATCPTQCRTLDVPVHSNAAETNTLTWSRSWCWRSRMTRGKKTNAKCLVRFFRTPAMGRRPPPPPPSLFWWSMACATHRGSCAIQSDATTTCWSIPVRSNVLCRKVCRKVVKECVSSVHRVSTVHQS
jgi:hypothetical protein